MSFQTHQHSAMAMANLQAARNARRSGNHHLADALASSARVHADLCRQVANTMNAEDMNDTEAASAAAAAAEDLGMSGGRGEWRSPGDALVAARQKLDRLHARSVGRPRARVSTGTRSLFEESRW